MKPILIGVIAVIVVVVVVLGVLFIPSLLSHKKPLSEVAAALASSASKHYGGNWYAEPNATVLVHIYSNSSAKIIYLNGSSIITSFNESSSSINFLSSSIVEYITESKEIEAVTLKESSTSNSITIEYFVFPNKADASNFYNELSYYIEAQYLFLGAPNITYKGYSGVYYPGGIATILGYNITLEGIAAMIHNNNLIVIVSKGVVLDRSFIESVISTLS